MTVREWDKDRDLRICSHPNCEQHGKSPCEGVNCDGLTREDRLDVDHDAWQFVITLARDPFAVDEVHRLRRIALEALLGERVRRH